MARPLRIEFPGALYHVTSRGNQRAAIFQDDADRERFIGLLGEVVERFHWRCLAWCLMPNHYHLMVETPDANLSKGMRQLNGVFTQYVNRRHGRVGHLFQGRFKGILVDSDSYLLELARYVVLNPVRAGLVERPEDWPWSSYRQMTGKAPPPAWLDADSLLAAFGSDRRAALRAYARLVAGGIGGPSIWANLNRQIYLGDDAFVARSQRHAEVGEDLAIPREQRRPPPPSLAEIEREAPSRNAAIVAAYATGGYSYADLGRHFGLHFTQIGRIVRQG